jgi:hypothetical protein
MQGIQFPFPLCVMQYVELHANRTILNPKQYSYPHLLIRAKSLQLVMLAMSMSVPRMSESLLLSVYNLYPSRSTVLLMLVHLACYISLLHLLLTQLNSPRSVEDEEPHSCA